MSKGLDIKDVEFIVVKEGDEIIFQIKHPIYDDRNFSADSNHLDEVLHALDDAVKYLHKLGVSQSELEKAKVEKINKVDESYLHGFMGYYHSMSFGLDDEVPETSGVFIKVDSSEEDEKGFPFDVVPHNADDSFSAELPSPVSIDEVVEPVGTDQIVFSEPVESDLSEYPVIETKKSNADKEKERRAEFDAVIADPEKRKSFYKLIYITLKRNTSGVIDESLVAATGKIMQAAEEYKPYPKKLIRAVGAYLTKQKPTQDNFNKAIGTLCNKLIEYGKK